MQGPGTVESLDQQHKASRGRFSIGNGHGFDSILRGAMDFECQPCLDGGPDARRSVQALPGRTRNLSTTTLMQVKSIIQSLR